MTEEKTNTSYKSPTESVSFKTFGVISSVLVMGSVIVGATLWISTHIASLRVVLNHHQAEIEKLADFAEKGDRFTESEGKRLEQRVTDLEAWTRSAPPTWFRNLFTDFKTDISEDVKDLGKTVNSLTLEIHALKLQIKAVEKQLMEHSILSGDEARHRAQ